jgi:hypothetical protein
LVPSWRSQKAFPESIGPSFGFRAGCFTHAVITGDDHPDEGEYGLEEYWPGMFVCFESSDSGKFKEDGGSIRVRSGDFCHPRAGDTRKSNALEPSWPEEDNDL